MFVRMGQSWALSAPWPPQLSTLTHSLILILTPQPKKCLHTNKCFHTNKCLHLCPGEEIKYFATVVQHDLDKVVRVDSQGRPHPVVGLHFRDRDVPDALMFVGRGVVPDLSLVQAGTNLFTYRPVLRSLQQMDSIPLAPELVLGRSAARAEYLRHIDVEAELVSGLVD